MNELSLAQFGGLFLRFLMLSLLSIGGAITAAPEMHRYLVGQQGWLSDTQFTSSIALAQAAPGPNILFVAVLGWNVAGPLGALATMAGIMLPSTTLVLAATRWAREHKHTVGVRAFTAGRWVQCRPCSVQVAGSPQAASSWVARPGSAGVERVAEDIAGA